MANLGELVRILEETFPGECVGDSQFTRRALLLDGLEGDEAEEDLEWRFSNYGKVLARMVVQAYHRRGAILVFPTSVSCSLAMGREHVLFGSRTIFQLVRNALRFSWEAATISRRCISLLFNVAPGLIEEDPSFLNRSAFVLGVSPAPVMTTADLAKSFALEVNAAVLARGRGESGDGAGLVVFPDPSDVSVATAVPRGPGSYRRCIPARDVGLTRRMILESAWDETRRRDTWERLRSMLPDLYLQQGSRMDLQFRCIFFLIPPGAHIDRGVLTLSTIASNILEPGKNMLCGGVVCGGESRAVLVYDDELPDHIRRRSNQLLMSHGLIMYDSSSFPMRLTSGAAAAAAAEREQDILLPPFFARPEYSGRVVLLTNLVQLDASELADDLMMYRLEALFVFRSRRCAVAVLSSVADCSLLLAEPETRDYQLMDYGVMESFNARANSAPAPDLIDPVRADAMDYVHYTIRKRLDECSCQDMEGIARMLMETLAISRSQLMQHPLFSMKAVLLLGVSPWCPYDMLLAELRKIREVDKLLVCGEKMAGLAVFSSWVGAGMLLLEPAHSWLRMGFRHCCAAPGADAAPSIAQGVLSEIDRDEETRRWVYELVDD